MIQEKDSMETPKAVKSPSLHSSLPPPGNEETMAENIHQSQIETTEALTNAKTNQSEAEPEYPTLKKLIPTVIALYLAFFLVALVWHTLPVPSNRVKANHKIGSYNHRNRYTYNHR